MLVPTRCCAVIELASLPTAVPAWSAVAAPRPLAILTFVALFADVSLPASVIADWLPVTGVR